LPAHQLAGHVANLEFWINEATHALMVIDGYQQRFKRLRAGQAAYQLKHGVASTSTPIQRSAKHLTRQELRRSITEAMERFLASCHSEGLLSAEKLRTALASLEHEKVEQGAVDVAALAAPGI
jgi:hypothetical protein